TSAGITPGISMTFSGASTRPSAGSSISVPSRATNSTLRIIDSLHLTDRLQQQVVVLRTADRDSHAVGERVVRERAHEDAGTVRRRAQLLGIAHADEDEVRVARIDLEHLRRVEQRLGEPVALALQ